MADAPILRRVDGRAGRLTLNRPKALHALNAEMCQLLTDGLRAFVDDADVDLVILDHTGPRGFCAGGDVKMMAASGRGDGLEARGFFRTEYRLNHLLQGFPKPVVAVMDGVTMGGGVGLSVHGSHRLVTERTVFAMPETAIGFFPDVGGGWFLPRLGVGLGTWLGLTGARITGTDVVRLGVGTHFIDSAELPSRLAALCDGGQEALATLRPPPPSQALLDPGLLAPFERASIRELLDGLDAAGDAWSRDQAQVLRARSRQSLEVTLRHLRQSARATSFADVMRVEYRLAVRLVATADFQEGVRAAVIDKDGAPRWSDARTDVDALFAPLPREEEWTPLP